MTDDELNRMTRQQKQELAQRLARECFDVSESLIMLQGRIRAWSLSIFKGDAEWDSQKEQDFIAELKKAISEGHRVAHEIRFYLRSNSPDCGIGINGLHWRLVEAHFMLDGWVTPKLAVAPGPRTKHTPEQIKAVRENMKRLGLTRSE